MTEVTFEAGAWIFQAGDPAEQAYLVRSGEVEILEVHANPPKRVAVFGKGMVFGEMSLVEERPRSSSARALSAVTAAALTREDFERLLASNPAKAKLYLRSLFERLRSLSARLAEATTERRAELILAPIPLAETPAAAPPVAVDESIPMAEPVPQGPVAFPIAPGQDVLVNAPTVVVLPLTRKAAETLPDEGLWVTNFPLRIGRAPGPNEPESLDLNDLWLLDDKPYNVSRNHCEIALDDKNRVLIRDRGSHVGCIVNEQVIGGRAPYGYTRLHPGENVMVLGGRMSPYQFRVTVG